MPDSLVEVVTRPEPLDKVPDMITIAELAEITHLSMPTIRDRLARAGVKPDARTSARRACWYKLTTTLIEIARTSHVDKKWRPGPQVHRPVTKIEGNALVDEEREKKKWVGRMGYFEIEGHRTETGEITHVSMAGCFIGKRKGMMSELRLCD